MKSVDFALTCTLQPKFCKYPIELQCSEMDDEFKNCIKKVKDSAVKCTAVIELTKSFNVHLHAIISYVFYKKPNIPILRQIYDCFRDSKIIGFVFAKPVEDFYIWTQYIMKDVRKTMETLKCFHPVISNDYFLDFDLGFGVEQE